MALLETPALETTLAAPDFTLKNIDEAMISLEDAKGEKGTVIAFICNHCPYVLAIIDRFVEDAARLKSQGINTIAIMPNDTGSYPGDSFANMKLFAKKYSFNFPYVIDEIQETAKAYDAVCTPDIYGLNSSLEIVYRGRLDSAGKGTTDENTMPELYNAMLEIARTGHYTETQHPSMGCSIKWK